MTNDDETAYREEVNSLTHWCQENSLSLNVSKTKEIIANRKALLRVIRTAQHITGGELPSLQAIYNIRCVRKAQKIIKDPNHPSHSLLLSLLPSGISKSFFPQAIRLLNYNWCTTLLHKYIINITIQHTYPHYIYYVKFLVLRILFTYYIVDANVSTVCVYMYTYLSVYIYNTVHICTYVYTVYMYIVHHW